MTQMRAVSTYEIEFHNRPEALLKTATLTCGTAISIICRLSSPGNWYMWMNQGATSGSASGERADLRLGLHLFR
jgi:hypothetical protein